MYQVVIDRYAEKQLKKIPPPHFNRIVKAIGSLADNPRPNGCKKLEGVLVIEFGLEIIG